MKYLVLAAMFVIVATVGYVSYQAYHYHLTAESIVKYSAEAKAKNECLNQTNSRLNFVNGKWVCDKIKFR